MKTFRYKPDPAFYKQVIILLLLIPYFLTAQVSFKEHEFSKYIDSPSSNYFHDFNEDGKLDFMVEGGTGIAIYINQGDWQFKPHKIYDDFCLGFAIGDIDTDGDKDFFIQESSNSRLLKKQDNLEYILSEIKTTLAGVSTVKLADIDQDGRLDIFWAAGWSYGVYWWRNLGNDNFEPRLIDDLKIHGVEDAKILDIDKDGDLDICTTEYHYSKFIIWINDGQQNFTPHIINNNCYETDFQIYDLNNDGLMDFLMEDLRLLINRGDLKFETIELPFTEYTQSFKAGDIDLDGDLDIFGTRGGTAIDFIYWENDGSLNFKEHIIKSYGDFSAGYPNLTDIDQDGDLDCLTTSSFNNRIIIWENLLIDKK